MAILGIDFLRAYKLFVDPTAGKLVPDGTGLTLSTISSFSGATTLAIVSSGVPGPLGQAATSPLAVPGPLNKAATSPSTVPASGKLAVSSSSSTTVTGPPPSAKPSSRLAAQLPIFFQLLLQQYQDDVNLAGLVAQSVK
jgi:hypothetical protein